MKQILFLKDFRLIFFEVACILHCVGLSKRTLPRLSSLSLLSDDYLF